MNGQFIYHGIFHSQLDINTFMFESGHEKHQFRIVDSNRYCPPLLLCVYYSIQIISIGKAKIIGAKKMSWSPVLHRMFFPSTPYNSETYKLTNKNPEFERWRTLDDMADRLVSGIQTNQYITLVHNEQFEKLVYDFPGCVLPWVLSTYVGKNHILVRQASVLRYILDVMKKTRKVWLNKNEIGRLLCVEDNACQILIEKEVIMYDAKNELIALCWAAKSLQQLRTRELTVTFKAGATPLRVKDTKNEYQVDPMLPANRYLDYSYLPTSFLIEPISHPSPLIPTCYSDWNSVLQTLQIEQQPVICVSRRAAQTWYQNEEVIILNNATCGFEQGQTLIASKDISQPGNYVLRGRNGMTKRVPFMYIQGMFSVITSMRYCALEDLNPSREYGTFVIISSPYMLQETAHLAHKFVGANKVHLVTINVSLS